MKKELSTGFNARQYMNSGEFEVFFYNDIDLDHVVDHTHPYYEIYFFLNGDVTYEVDGNRYEIPDLSALDRESRKRLDLYI